MLHLNQKYLKSGKKRLSYGQFTKGRLRDSSKYHAIYKESIRASLDLKSGQKWQSYGQLTNGRLCATQASIMRNVGDLLGLHLNQKYLKLRQKRLSYGQFTKGRLRDLREYHARCKGSIRASFEPKRFKIRQETVDLWPFYQWEVA